MRHRIFIAINLPEDIRKRLVSYQEQIEELFTPYRTRSGTGPARWTKPENLHITLVFLGYLSDEEMVKVCEITREVASKNRSFFIHLNKICYAPPKKMPPRMVWAEGACPELVEGKNIDKLTKLRNNLENSLASDLRYKKENRPFSPHITLARISKWDFRRIEPEDRPQVETALSLTFEVNSIEVMESQLKRGGSEYTILESCQLSS